MTEEQRIAQIETYKSFERENPHWKDGQARTIHTFFAPVLIDHPNARIADIACGDGVGLEVFRAMGLQHVCGFELSPEKAERARRFGYNVIEQDFHKLRSLPAGSLDIIYSSHSLEHAHDPRAVLDGFHHVLSEEGLLYLIVPYPDTGPLEAHCGKLILGTAAELPNDGGAALLALLRECKFEPILSVYDTWREPEIWVIARRK